MERGAAASEADEGERGRRRPTAPTWTAVGDGCVIWRLHGAE